MTGPTLDTMTDLEPRCALDLLMRDHYHAPHPAARKGVEDRIRAVEAEQSRRLGLWLEEG